MDLGCLLQMEGFEWESSACGSIVMAIAVEGKERWEGVDNRRMEGKNSNWGRVESVYSGKVER